MSEEEKLDLSFLKTGIWKDTGKSFEQMKKMFLANYAAEKVRRPNLSGEDLMEAATLSFQGRMTEILSGRGTDHTTFMFGMTRPMDYFASWSASRLKKYRLYKNDNKQDKIAEMVADHLIKVEILNGVEVPYAVDSRPTFGKGENKKENENFDKRFKNRQGGSTAYLSNVIALVKQVGNPEWQFQQIMVGGENSDDSFLRLKCEKCGFESPLVNCPGYIEKTDPVTGAKRNVPCGNVRSELQIEQIMQSTFKFSNVRLGENQTSGDKSWTRESMIEDCAENVKDLVPKWTAKEIKERKGVKYERLPDEMKFLLKCDAVKDRWVDSTILVETWTSHPPHPTASGSMISDYIILWECTVTSITREPDKMKMRSILCIDSKMGFKGADGKTIRAVSVRIPEHVWECGGGKQLTEFSKIVVAGTIDRREQWDRVAKKSIPGQYRDPEITSVGIFAYDLARPTVAPKLPVEQKHKIDDGLTTDEEIELAPEVPDQASPEPAPAPVVNGVPTVASVAAAIAMDVTELQAMVDEKVASLNNLIKPDAAMIIVASELGYQVKMDGSVTKLEAKPAKKVAKKPAKKPSASPEEVVTEQNPAPAPANVKKQDQSWF